AEVASDGEAAGVWVGASGPAVPSVVVRASGAQSESASRYWSAISFAIVGQTSAAKSKLVRVCSSSNQAGVAQRGVKTGGGRYGTGLIRYGMPRREPTTRWGSRPVGM